MSSTNLDIIIVRECYNRQDYYDCHLWHWYLIAVNQIMVTYVKKKRNNFNTEWYLVHWNHILYFVNEWKERSCATHRGMVEYIITRYQYITKTNKKDSLLHDVREMDKHTYFTNQWSVSYLTCMSIKLVFFPTGHHLCFLLWIQMFQKNCSFQTVWVRNKSGFHGNSLFVSSENWNNHCFFYSFVCHLLRYKDR